MDEKVDNLKPEVREAYSTLDAEVSPSGRVSYEAYRAWCTIHAELVRLAGENETLERAVSKHVLRCAEFLQRVERAESELAALKRRVAESPIAFLHDESIDGDDDWQWVLRSHSERLRHRARIPDGMEGKPVRLLLDDGETPVTPAV